MRVRHLFDRAGRGRQGALGRCQVTGVADQISQTGQRLGGDAVPGRQGLVGQRSGPVNKALGIVRGEVEAAPRSILEVLQKPVGQAGREGQPTQNFIAPRMQAADQLSQLD